MAYLGATTHQTASTALAERELHGEVCNKVHFRREGFSHNEGSNHKNHEGGQVLERGRVVVLPGILPLLCANFRSKQKAYDVINPPSSTVMYGL